MTLSYSEIDTYMRCPQKYEYKYDMGLRLPRRTGGAMYLGTMYHDLQAVRASGGSPSVRHREMWNEVQTDPYWDLYSVEDQQEVMDRTVLAYELLQQWVKKREREEEVIAVEETFEHAGFSGTPDLVYRDGDLTVVRDYKTASTIPNEMPLSFQPYMYLWLLHHNGFENLVFEYDYIRSKLPATPELRKDGKISRLASVDTDYSTLLQTAGEYNLLHLEEVRERANDLFTEQGKWVRRYYIHWSEDMVKPIGEQLSTWRYDLQAHDTRMAIQPYGGFDSCASCDYAALCKARLNARPLPWSMYVTEDQ